MQLDIKAFAFAAGLLWGGMILVVGIANGVWPGYGQAFLDLAASVYPGYGAAGGFRSVVGGTLYGFFDGAIGGVLLAWPYNLIADRRRTGR